MSHAGELPAKFKHVAGTGVFGGGVDPGEIKDFHDTRKMFLQRMKRTSVANSVSHIIQMNFRFSFWFVTAVDVRTPGVD